MSAFDFRDMLGGADGRVQPDESLADGVRAGNDVDGLHWHLTSHRPGVDIIVEGVARNIIVNCNVNRLCIPAILALVIARLGRTALEEMPAGTGIEERAHLIAELQAMLDAMRTGDR